MFPCILYRDKDKKVERSFIKNKMASRPEYVTELSTNNFEATADEALTKIIETLKLWNLTKNNMCIFLSRIRSHSNINRWSIIFCVSLKNFENCSLSFKADVEQLKTDRIFEKYFKKQFSNLKAYKWLRKKSSSIQIIEK